MELLTKGCRETNIIDKEHHRETTAGSVNSYFEKSNLLVLVRFAVAFFMLEILNDAIAPTAGGMFQTKHSWLNL